jgi:deoxycytidylate deaminase
MDQRTIDLFFMRQALAAACMSDDPEKKVGAALLTDTGRGWELGYNRIPFPLQRITRYHNPDLKQIFIVHAEMDVLGVLGNMARQGTIYVTQPVCHVCAKHLILANIRRVVTLKHSPTSPTGYNPDTKWSSSWEQAWQMFAEAKVEQVELDGSELVGWDVGMVIGVDRVPHWIGGGGGNVGDGKAGGLESKPNNSPTSASDSEGQDA